MKKGLKKILKTALGLGTPVASISDMRINHPSCFGYYPNLTILRIHQQMYGPERYISFGPAPHHAAPCHSGKRESGGFGIDIATQHAAPENAPPGSLMSGAHSHPVAPAINALAGGPPASATVGNLLDVMG